jgi:hypothetical protein
MDDTRIVAEWLHKWEPRVIDDGSEEYFVDDQQYSVEVCDIMIDAAKLAESKDVCGAGSVIVEEHQYQETYKGIALYAWVEIDRYDAGDVITRDERLRGRSS